MAGKNVSYKEYENILKARDRFETKTMKDHHNLCLKYDVFLLADVFETFRNSSFKNYWLHPRCCLSALPLRWDALL